MNQTAPDRRPAAIAGPNTQALRWVTRGACWRLAALALVAGGLGCAAWCTMIRMPLQSSLGPVPPLSAADQELRGRLQQHVIALAGDIGERNVFTPRQLAAAADWIESVLADAGYTVASQSFPVQAVSCRNLEAAIPGRSRPEEIIVVGAHYDSVSGSPGANDNGSAVAVLIELARAWAGSEPARTMRWVAFVNEEPPFFQTARMGSLVYARACRARGDNIVAMLSLETIGYYDDRPGSQQYPFPVGLFYPSRGDFLAFVSNTANAGLVRDCIRVFREQAAFPSQGAALPGWLPGIGWSDHWAFWQVGYAALMVTDTAPFRYPHYHQASDTPDQLDYDRLARVTTGLHQVVEALANP